MDLDIDSSPGQMSNKNELHVPQSRFFGHLR